MAWVDEYASVLLNSLILRLSGDEDDKESLLSKTIGSVTPILRRRTVSSVLSLSDLRCPDVGNLRYLNICPGTPRSSNCACHCLEFSVELVRVDTQSQGIQASHCAIRGFGGHLGEFLAVVALQVCLDLVSRNFPIIDVLGNEENIKKSRKYSKTSHVSVITLPSFRKVPTDGQNGK
jgi:hypothetical protein